MDATESLELERVVSAARDAVTDDMVSRLSQAVGEALDLLDQLNRSGIGKALPALTRMIENGDLDRVASLARTYAAAEAAATDDMIGRVSEAVAGGLDLLDQVNRSGVSKALPALARLVEDGDLDRVASLARTYAAAEAAATDDMIGRVSEALSGGLDLLDQVNRAGVSKALPALARLVEDGDLDRLAALARTYAAAEAAVTDDMIGRLAETMGTSLSLVDRLNRAGIDRVVSVFERLTVGGGLDKLDETAEKLGIWMKLLEQAVESMDAAAQEAKAIDVGRAGVLRLLPLLRDPETHRTLHFALSFAKRFRAQLHKL